MRILITGGTGYVGSHCAVGLLNQNHDVVVLDNLSNSYKEVVQKIEMIAKTTRTSTKVKLLIFIVLFIRAPTFDSALFSFAD